MSPIDPAISDAVRQAATLRSVPISSIKENPVALRGASTESEEFIGLAESIKQRGVLNPILLRPIPSDNGQEAFGLIDGLQRFTAAKAAGLTEIPALIVTMSDAEVLEAQIITNVHRVETQPVQYTKQLIRILGQNPTMTLASLANKLSRTPQWLEDRLGLVGLTPDIQALVDEGKIALPNAYVLAKLPQEEQAAKVEEAQFKASTEFVPAVNARLKEIREAKRQGRAANPPSFTPIPRVQKMGDLKVEAENPTVGPQILARNNVTDPLQAWKLAVQWALKLDPESIAEARNRFEAEQAEQEDKKKRREEEKKKRILEKAEKDKAATEKALAELA